MHHKDKLHAALLNRNSQVPRYTSYPTAPHFSEKVGGDTFATWLGELGDEATLSLYFHIPFCRKLCWYCGCNTKATRKYEPVESYLDYLWREIEMVAAKLSGRQTVTHIHFGGGSPSMLTPQDFERLVGTIRKRFNIADTAEIAIELDPREVSEAKVAAYAKAGINRASLGVQDFHEDVQVAINRRQPFHQVYETVQLLRTYGIAQINMDLLYGLPHQSVSHIEENVDFAAALGPNRISLFGYAHVPWMKKHMQLIDESALPAGADRLQQFDSAKEQLVKRGFVPVGLDHFVHPKDPMAKAVENGSLKRNFQGYTTDAADALIGFGVSAISAMPQGYAQNSNANRQYYDTIADGRFAVCRGIETSKDDRVRRALIEKLMCQFEVDLARFCGEQGVDITEFSGALTQLRALATDGLVELDRYHIRIPEDARQAVRLVAAAFDRYLVPREQRHAQVA